MIAEYIAELLYLLKQTGRSIQYEVATCAFIPLIRKIEEHYDNNL